MGWVVIYRVICWAGKRHAGDLILLWLADIFNVGAQIDGL
jgi:hypothetical protein